MEGYLRLALLIIAFVIVMLIIYETRMRRKYLKSAMLDPDEVLGLPTREAEFELSAPTIKTLETPKPALTGKPRNFAQDLLVISVVARDNNVFASYDLLQAITGAGLQFGAMNIFHYYQKSSNEKIPLFSLASATEPGEFNLDHIGDFSCLGLTLFADMSAVPDPKQAFELMLKSAEQLADDLGGELRTSTRAPWSEETLLQYQQRISQYQAITT